MYLNKLTINDVRKELGEIISDKTDDYIEYGIRLSVERLAIKILGRLPYINTFVPQKSCPMVYTMETGEDSAVDEEGEVTEYEFSKSEAGPSCVEEKLEAIDTEKSLNNLLKVYPDAQVLNIVSPSEITDSIIIHDDFIYYSGRFYMDTPGLPQKILDCVEKKLNKSVMWWVLRDSRGHIKTRRLEIKEMGSVSDNYNDDFIEVDKKLTKLLHDENSWISILHGKPGTGKTSYLRDLIGNNRDINFYWLDTSMFNYIDSSEFIDFLSERKNSVFILEDCENLLRSREEGTNTAMQSLLSISDGMLGDSLNLKFICTFNTDLKNIDSAILRKGRMRIKYEFKELKKEKAKKLLKKLGFNTEEEKDMLLCDIYNFDDDNGNAKKKENGKKLIGF